MQSLWNDEETSGFNEDQLQWRVYSSRLLGKNSDLVLHGGGNTSVKVSESNIFGEQEDLLYVKGSGWDLATIEKKGFSPVRMDALLKMAKLETLSDGNMVKNQRTAMTDPDAPNPSVEAILHAIIPFRFVDHTHADAVVTISNSLNGEKKLREIYGNSVFYIPYVMPGFDLAKLVFKLTSKCNWKDYKGMILLNHGVFTFDDDAKASYEKMIDLVTQAEQYIAKNIKSRSKEKIKQALTEPEKLSHIRKLISEKAGYPVVLHLNEHEESIAFSSRKDVISIASKGPLTPDHVIRTKRTPVIFSNDIQADIITYEIQYKQYFERNKKQGQVCLDPAPRWVIWPGHGFISFARTVKESKIINDICEHTIKAITQAEKMGGWSPLSEHDIFDVEYWELEQAKLKKSKTIPLFTGKIVLITGAASGIGKACTEYFLAEGACVAGLDINTNISDLLNFPEALGIQCDISDKEALTKAVKEVVLKFGGIDILVNNAGLFPESADIETVKASLWTRSLDINLTAHKDLLQLCLPYLKNGIDPSVIFVASKNVPAPGPSASAYSVAKAGLTQLARVAALELGKFKIRVNVVHPNAVYDTGLWDDEIIEKRAKNYGLSAVEYKSNNVLKTEVDSKDVGRLITTMAGPVFSKITGAQIPIDGGNDRVI